MDQNSASPSKAANNTADQGIITGALPPDLVAAQGFDLRASVARALGHFQQLIDNRGETSGHSTGFPELDGLIHGLKPGKVLVIAARPSIGQTSLMLNIAEHICIDQNVPTLILSARLSAFEMVQRLLFSRARYALSQFNEGGPPQVGDLQRIQRAAHELSHANLIVDDTADLAIDVWCAKARHHKLTNDIGFIAIDCCHLLKSTQAHESKEREAAGVFTTIKCLATELAIPILVLVQLNNRPAPGTGGQCGPPRVSDFGEDSYVNQAADMIALLHRDDSYGPAPDNHTALILTKNHGGLTGVVPLTYLTEIWRFESPMHAEEEEQREAWDAHFAEKAKKLHIPADGGFSI